MTFNDFQHNLIESLKTTLNNTDLAEAELSLQKVDKLNGEYNSLCIKPKDSIIGMNINLDSIYKAFEEGVDYETLVKRTTEECIDGLASRPLVNLNELTDYSKIKDKLSLEVVSAERNANTLKSIPHNMLEDMAVITRIVLDKTEYGSATIVITDSLCKQFGITKEQLFEDALVNAPIVRPSEIKGMSEVMSEMMPGLMPEVAPEDEQIFVASVPDKNHGAGVIAYPNFMEDAAQKLGGSFYLLPSSIHELLLVKDNGQMSAQDLENMVKEVNATQVEPCDQLTDHVYFYDAQKHVFQIASTALKSA